MFADLHIHSCLSPCGHEWMTPGNIAGMAKIKELEAAICLPENASDYQMLADLSRELEENKLRHDEALEEWMELE